MRKDGYFCELEVGTFFDMSSIQQAITESKRLIDLLFLEKILMA